VPASVVLLVEELRNVESTARCPAQEGKGDIAATKAYLDGKSKLKGIVNGRRHQFSWNRKGALGTNLHGAPNHLLRHGALEVESGARRNAFDLRLLLQTNVIYPQIRLGVI
jgi:hypothetical protein